MRNVVIDTNCLIQILPKRSPFYFIWEAYLRNEFTLCVSTAILEEYHEILNELTSPIFADLILAAITTKSNTLFINPYFNFELIKSDPDDNKFIDCAIVANADCIVTNDHHFDEAKRCPFPKVEILSLKEFAEILKRDN